MELKHPVNKRSKFKGVRWHHQRHHTEGKWRASIMCNGVHYSLGRFENEDEAAEAYDKKAIELLGPRAKTNFQNNR